MPLLHQNRPIVRQLFRGCRCYGTYVREAPPGKKVLAIRREDFSVWERRAPLSPSHVRALVKKGYKVLVQPSNRRAYPMQEYANAGAIISEDISDAKVILGVKQVPIDVLEPEKTYVFFSHTIKAQEANMPLLDAILKKNIRLIDYEKMMDPRGSRVVAFGKYAGVAGMINIFHGLGLRLLALGHHTPFMHIGLAHNYRNSDVARQAIRDAGYEIALGLMPKSMGPLTFVFTGSGNVSHGAQEVFQDLPHEYVSPEHLESVAKHGSTRKVYACEVSREHHLVNKEVGGYDAAECEEFPERYVSTFSRTVAPYTSVLVNGIYWAPTSPRLLAIPDAKTLLRPTNMPWLPSSEGTPQLPHRLMAICDISADPGGSIEFMRSTTTIDSPFELYDADQNIHTVSGFGLHQSDACSSFSGPGVLICSIDNMPAQIPREATDFFGGLLMPYIPEIAVSDAETPFEEYDVSPVIKDAVIASNGDLVDKYKYIANLRKANLESKQKCKSVTTGGQKVLVLGSGYVSAPVVDYLTRQKDIQVTVASQFQHEIDSLAERFENTTPVLMDVQRSLSELDTLIREHDLVISLLPYTLHPEIANICIKEKTNMVTASYRSPAMMALHQKAVDAGVTIVNEVGVDPGIDHLLAMEVFDEIKENGGKVRSFVSWCGGLPAAESSSNPLRYRFSWSPRGVLMNVLSSARWLQNGQVKEVAENGALLDSVQTLDFLPGFNLEGFANRDSTIYTDLYGIQSAKTLLRGTLRYQGFSNAMKGLVQLGMISDQPHTALHPKGPDITWKGLMSELVGQKKDILIDTLKDVVTETMDGDVQRLLACEELGLFDEELVDKKTTPIDTLSNFLSKKLAFDNTERDIIIMRHEIGVEWSDQTREMHNVDFVVYGEPKGYTAMAATVGYPTAIAAKMVLEGEIQERGTILPFNPSIYKPMLTRLQQLGLTAKGYTTPYNGEW